MRYVTVSTIGVICADSDFLLGTFSVKNRSFGIDIYFGDRGDLTLIEQSPTPEPFVNCFIKFIAFAETSTTGVWYNSRSFS